MSSEEDNLLFKVYHISGYSGSIGSPDITADSIVANVDTNTTSAQMDDDSTLN